MNHLIFFPTPYPDEILYSVLCRFHTRYGSPGVRKTNDTLWGKTNGKKLYLPDGIDSLSSQIPPGTNLTAEHFIKDNTIFPLFKPFLPQIKCNELFGAMKSGNSYTYSIIGFASVFDRQHKYLRYCEQCFESDTQIFGEPYWHRVHQLPGVYVCPIHNTVTTLSNIELASLRDDFYPITRPQYNSTKSFEPGVATRLLDYANDMAWLLENGYGLNYFEHTAELYDNWLRVKGYRNHNGYTSRIRLNQHLVEYYGQDFLTFLRYSLIKAG